MVRERTRCANCGAAVDCRVWHPAAAPVGTPGVYAFCGPACRRVWVAHFADS